MMAMIVSELAQIFQYNNKCNAKNNELLSSIHFNEAVKVDGLTNSNKAIKAY